MTNDTFPRHDSDRSNWPANSDHAHTASVDDYRAGKLIVARSRTDLLRFIEQLPSDDREHAAESEEWNSATLWYAVSDRRTHRVATDVYGDPCPE